MKNKKEKDHSIRTVYVSEVKNKDGESFFKVKKVDDWYLYGERLGVDSIAFILYDSNKEKPFGIIEEIKPPLYERGIEKLKTAFGGSIDKNKNLIDIVIDEVREEAGYIVGPENVEFVGKIFVSTQMNQFCYLYFVDINNSKFVGQNLEENEKGNVKWVSKDEIVIGKDWKAITILTKKGFLKWLKLL